MLNSFLPQHTRDLAHPLFAPIVCLLEFLLFLIAPFEVVVRRHNDLGGAIELASEVRDVCFQSFNSFSLPSPSSRILRAFLFLCSLLSFFDSSPFSPTCLG